MKLDPNINRFNQLCIVVGVALAMIFHLPTLIAMISLVLIVGTLQPRFALFKNFYSSVIRPLLRLTVQLRDDDPRAHNFVQGVAGGVLAAATLAFISSFSLLGWGLASMVALLALLNLATRFCVGCFLYFQFKLMQARFSR
jgi:hypothetical protein